jgi:hypothetical protein
MRDIEVPTTKKRSPGRPKKPSPKLSVTFRLPQEEIDIMDSFREWVDSNPGLAGITRENSRSDIVGMFLRWANALREAGVLTPQRLLEDFSSNGESSS